MIRVGCVNIDTSHPGAFSQILNAGERARYTAIYNDGFRKDDEVQGFMKANGIVKRCMNLEEMAEQTDVAFIHSCNWDRHLEYAEPFIQLGKLVFIDKPIVGNIRDIERLRKLVKDGATILGCSCMRYAKGITDFLSMPIEERGEIVSVHSSCGVDEFNYAIHAVEAIGALLPRGAKSCQYIGGGQFQGVCSENYAICYENGASAVYSITCGQWQRSVVTVITTKQTFVLEIGGYEPMLDRVLTSVETGVRQTAPVEELIESIMIMLAGRISRKNGGMPVNLSDIPSDDPGYDGYAFEAAYAAAAPIIYAK